MKTLPPAAITADELSPPRKPMNYRWVLVLIVLAIVVSILLVYAENRVYQPSTPFAGGSGDHVHALALDPLHPNHLYLGTHYGFFRTTDGGANWTRLNGASGIAATLVATSITLSPIDSRTVYVTGYRLDTGNATGIYVTQDDGGHWQHLTTGGAGQLPDARVLFVAAGWAQPGEAYTYSIDYGLFRTLDRGAHWTKIAPPFAGQVTAFVPVLACPAGTSAMTGTACPERIFIGTTQGLAIGDVTASGVLTLTTQSTISTYVYAVAAHRGANPVVYVSTDQGLFQAGSPTAALGAVSTVAQGAPTLSSLAVSGANANSLYGVTPQDAVETSQDGGHSWLSLGTSLQTRDLSQLQAGLRQATGNNTPQWAGGQNTFLTLLQAPATSTSEVFAALSFPVQLFSSTTSGQQWQDLSNGG